MGQCRQSRDVFSGSQGRSKAAGGVLSRERVSLHTDNTVPDAGQLLFLRGGGLEIVIALMSIHSELDSTLLTAYSSGFQWKVWTRGQVTIALRVVGQQRGLQPSEYALHSRRIGGATRLAAAGLPPAVIQRE